MRPESPRLVRLAVSPDIGLPLFTALQSPDLAISPDGEQIAYLTGSVGLGAEQLQVRSLARATSEILVGEGVLNSPFFSADSQSVGFYDHSVEPALLKRVSVQGGATQTICELTGDLRGASWGADGTIVFASSFSSGGGGSGLFRVAAVGGAPEQLTTPDAEQGEFAHAWPEILPGGEAVLFSVLRGTSPSEDTEIAVLSLRSDIYAVGCVGYWLLTGGYVFEGRAPIEMLMQHIKEEPSPPSRRSAVTIPAELDALILRCLSKERSDRPQTGDELRAALDAIPLGVSWTRERARQWWDAHQAG